ncbi:hypothetical protein GPJ56_004715 [Histomonas meleagridis]|uniref:uncharacterized protein n=1 Tax=Histomonas meleagridis TaxID=135588 RepID=UPI00355A1AE1|nr:hypothetical protein GPJ56_004715 [Histomonas meleagridis]KAH0799542.1 hypothetical protein GO595_007610 [Histomonas meleagridis]
MSRVPLAPKVANAKQITDVKPQVQSQPELTEEEYTEQWNLEQQIQYLENALEETNRMNSELEKEVARLSNVENELAQQIEENNKLYDRYLELKKQCEY